VEGPALDEVEEGLLRLLHFHPCRKTQRSVYALTM
jgi:hypothetical protein